MSDTFTPPHRFGYREDRKDERDFKLYARPANIDSMPDRSMLNKLLPAVMDQSVTNSCTGFSGGTATYTVMKADGHRRPFVPSPVFLYRQARIYGEYEAEDMGAEIRFIWRAAAKIGLPPMSNLKPRFRSSDIADPQTGLFPEGSIWRREFSPSLLADAERRQALNYFRLYTLNDLLQCLADGFCAQVGFTVFRSFYGNSGPLFNVPDPVPGERDLGGHAVVAYGYDKPSRRIFFRNSWGPDAHEGKPDFTMSFEYYQRHSADCWTGRTIEGGKAVT